MKIPTIFGRPMVQSYAGSGNVAHWYLGVGAVTIMLDPDVICEPPRQSPTWELYVCGRSLGAGYRKGEATKRAEEWLAELHASLAELVLSKPVVSKTGTTEQDGVAMVGMEKSK